MYNSYIIITESLIGAIRFFVSMADEEGLKVPTSSAGQCSASAGRIATRVVTQ